MHEHMLIIYVGVWSCFAALHTVVALQCSFLQCKPVSLLAGLEAAIWLAASMVRDFIPTLYTHVNQGGGEGKNRAWEWTPNPLPTTGGPKPSDRLSAGDNDDGQLRQLRLGGE